MNLIAPQGVINDDNDEESEEDCKINAVKKDFKAPKEEQSKSNFIATYEWSS